MDIQLKTGFCVIASIINFAFPVGVGVGGALLARWLKFELMSRRIEDIAEILKLHQFNYLNTRTTQTSVPGANQYCMQGAKQADIESSDLYSRQTLAFRGKQGQPQWPVIRVQLVVFKERIEI